MRHDIDYCLESALKIAQIEKNYGIKSSYFFLVDSEYYTIFSESARHIICEISNMGHEICLHFDIARYEATSHQKIINFQASCLENIINNKINCVSYHNPGLVGLNNLSRNIQYNGYLNAYSEFFNNNFHYVSDSLCRFRDKDIFYKIKNKEFKNLHILTHPIWWSIDGTNAEKKMKLFLRDKSDLLFQQYKVITEKYRGLS